MQTFLFTPPLTLLPKALVPGLFPFASVKKLLELNLQYTLIAQSN